MKKAKQITFKAVFNKIYMLNIQITREQWKIVRNWLLRISGVVIGAVFVGFGIITTDNPLITFKNFVVAGSIIALIGLFFEFVIKKIFEDNALEVQVFGILFLLFLFAFVV